MHAVHDDGLVFGGVTGVEGEMYGEYDTLLDEDLQPFYTSADEVNESTLA